MCINIAMTTWRPAQSIEEFHLLFLAQISRRIDKRALVVKGGCNLRFFLKSVRYSEDMDLDVGDFDALALRDRVREVLASRPFRQILQARGTDIEHVTEHKQTDTTQRWKLGIRAKGNSGSAADEDRILASRSRRRRGIREC